MKSSLEVRGGNQQLCRLQIASLVSYIRGDIYNLHLMHNIAGISLEAAIFVNHWRMHTFSALSLCGAPYLYTLIAPCTLGALMFAASVRIHI
jgi:hypothetical protein